MLGNRARVILGAAVLVAVLGAVVSVTCESCRVSACRLLAWPERRVVPPGPDAGPEAVLRAYLEAVAARDADLMEQLAVPAFGEQERAGAFCTWERVEGLVVERTEALAFDHPGFSEVVMVSATFRLASRGGSGGPMDLVYALGEKGPGKGWRVVASEVAR
ncbi:hypothetical protein [Nonomuraea longicatena]|uniref:DUF4829 domain-containing protein n=1 Tax=Nonomuraea longicatena TaxID=83682 RepID=A0ABP3Z038_9ACTN